MNTTPQNTSNSGSELDDILDDALNTIQAYVQDEIQDDNGYPPFYGDGETFERVKSNAIAAINRLYIKRSDVVEAVGTMEDPDRMHASHSQCDIHCMPQLKLWARDDLRQEILTKLGLSGEQEDK